MALFQIQVKPGVPEYYKEGDHIPPYGMWKDNVDAYLLRCVGVSLADLADCNLRDWYEEGLRPIFAANRALAFEQGVDE